MPGNNFKKIETVRLNGSNFNINSLDNFILNQRVTECWRRAGNAYRLLPVSYTENWNLFERREKAQKIITALNSGATAFAAVKDSVIIGFALLTNQPFGSVKQYLELSEFYVSDKFRRRGTGKLLFEKICCEAKKAGAAKLYISAHSARESIAAYIKYGCKFAEEPDKEHILRKVKIKLDKVKVHKKSEFYLLFYSDDATVDNFISLNSYELKQKLKNSDVHSPEFYGSDYDINPNAETYFDGVLSKGNLYFRVFEKKKQIIINNRYFIIISFFVILIIIGNLYMCFLKRRNV